MATINSFSSKPPTSPYAKMPTPRKMDSNGAGTSKPSTPSVAITGPPKANGASTTRNSGSEGERRDIVPGIELVDKSKRFLLAKMGICSQSSAPVASPACTATGDVTTGDDTDSRPSMPVKQADTRKPGQFSPSDFDSDGSSEDSDSTSAGADRSSSSSSVPTDDAADQQQHESKAKFKVQKRKTWGKHNKKRLHRSGRAAEVITLSDDDLTDSPTSANGEPDVAATPSVHRKVPSQKALSEAMAGASPLNSPTVPQNVLNLAHQNALNVPVETVTTSAAHTCHATTLSEIPDKPTTSYMNKLVAKTPVAHEPAISTAADSTVDLVQQSLLRDASCTLEDYEDLINAAAGGTDICQDEDSSGLVTAEKEVICSEDAEVRELLIESMPHPTEQSVMDGDKVLQRASNLDDAETGDSKAGYSKNDVDGETGNCSNSVPKEGIHSVCENSSLPVESSAFSFRDRDKLTHVPQCRDVLESLAQVNIEILRAKAARDKRLKECKTDDVCESNEYGPPGNDKIHSPAEETWNDQISQQEEGVLKSESEDDLISSSHRGARDSSHLSPELASPKRRSSRNGESRHRCRRRHRSSTKEVQQPSKRVKLDEVLEATDEYIFAKDLYQSAKLRLRELVTVGGTGSNDVVDEDSDSSLVRGTHRRSESTAKRATHRIERRYTRHSDRETKEARYAADALEDEAGRRSHRSRIDKGDHGGHRSDYSAHHRRTDAHDRSPRDMVREHRRHRADSDERQVDRSRSRHRSDTDTEVPCCSSSLPPTHYRKKHKKSHHHSSHKRSKHCRADSIGSSVTASLNNEGTLRSHTRQRSNSSSQPSKVQHTWRRSAKHESCDSS